MPGFGLVPTTGFEPAHLLAPPPQDGVSTNFTTWAMSDKGTLIMVMKQDDLRGNLNLSKRFLLDDKCPKKHKKCKEFQQPMQLKL